MRLIYGLTQADNKDINNALNYPLCGFESGQILTVYDMFILMV